MVPVLAQSILNRAGALGKGSLAELWEACRRSFWFLEQFGAEHLLHGFFIATPTRGVICAPHTNMALQLVPRIVQLFRINSEWEKTQLYAYLLPIGDSKKAVDVVFNRRCREVKDGGVSKCYLV